jgi:hypothetical protein
MNMCKIHNFDSEILNPLLEFFPQAKPTAASVMGMVLREAGLGVSFHDVAIFSQCNQCLFSLPSGWKPYRQLTVPFIFIPPAAGHPARPSRALSLVLLSAHVSSVFSSRSFRSFI